MDFVLIRIYVLHCWVRLRRNVVLNPSSFRLSAQKIAICNSFAIVYIVHSTWVYNVKESTLPHPNWAVSLMLLFLLLSLVTSAASSALFCHPRPSILLLNGRNAHHTIPTIRRSRLRQSRDYHLRSSHRRRLEIKPSSSSTTSLFVRGGGGSDETSTDRPVTKVTIVGGTHGNEYTGVFGVLMPSKKQRTALSSANRTIITSSSRSSSSRGRRTNSKPTNGKERKHE